MKTIKEAAVEYAVKQHTNNEIFAPDRFSTIADFTAGVKYAQRWISVEDELPEKNTSLMNGKWSTEDVIVLTAHGDISDNRRIKNIDGEWVWLYSYDGDIPITHWRQIELK